MDDRRSNLPTRSFIHPNLKRKTKEEGRGRALPACTHETAPSPPYQNQGGEVDGGEIGTHENCFLEWKGKVLRAMMMMERRMCCPASEMAGTLFYL